MQPCSCYIMDETIYTVPDPQVVLQGETISLLQQESYPCHFLHFELMDQDSLHLEQRKSILSNLYPDLILILITELVKYMIYISFS